MRSRTHASLLLAGLIAIVCGNPIAAQTSKTDPPKGVTTPPESTKPPEPKWPTEIDGKDANAWLKSITDPDPALREAALRTLPGFGPDVRKVASKAILARMKTPGSGGEPDPGVRITLYNAASSIGFEDSKDETEAIRLLGLTVDQGLPGGHSRLHAVQTLGSIGPKAESAVYLIAGFALKDPSYETRRNIARTLGEISFNETKGPNVKALQALASTLVNDVSRSVRMEALQALVLLGPPWQSAIPPGGKVAPVINQQVADTVANAMRARLGIGPVKSRAAESDEQLQIWCRVVMMRFDPKEINEVNLAALAEHLKGKDTGPKVQSLQALSLFGEESASQLATISKVIDDDKEKDILLLSLGISTLASIGNKAQPAIPELERLEKRLAKMRDDKMNEPETFKRLSKLEPEQREMLKKSLPEEQLREAAVSAIKWIREAKPSGSVSESPPDTGKTPDQKKP